MRRALAFSALIPALLCGCVASEVCVERSGAETLTGASFSGEQTFTDSGEAGSVRFRATLRGLSELWPSVHPVQAAAVTVTLRFAYVGASETAGVATQMPRFGVDLASATSARTSYPTTTPAFPTSAGIPLYFTLFRECLGGAEGADCCEYGSTECSLDVVLRYQRQEGEPFPPVVLRWEASARADVNTCPLAKDAELVFEVLEP